MLLILGVFVFRTHYWLWHVAPGRNDIRWPFKLKPTMTKLYQYYDALQWKPMVDDILMKHGFGRDVTKLIMDYVDSIEIPDAADVEEKELCSLAAIASTNQLSQLIMRTHAADLDHRTRKQYEDAFDALDLGKDGLLDDFELAISRI